MLIETDRTMMTTPATKAAQSAACLLAHHCPPAGAFTTVALSGTPSAFGSAAPSLLFRRSPSLQSARNTCMHHHVSAGCPASAAVPPVRVSDTCRWPLWSSAYRECSTLSCFGLLGESCAGSGNGCNGEQPARLVLTRLAADAATHGPSPALAKSSAVTSSTCGSAASQQLSAVELPPGDSSSRDKHLSLCCCFADDALLRQSSRPHGTECAFEITVCVQRRLLTSSLHCSCLCMSSDASMSAGPIGDTPCRPTKSSLSSL